MGFMQANKYSVPLQGQAGLAFSDLLFTLKQWEAKRDPLML